MQPQRSTWPPPSTLLYDGQAVAADLDGDGIANANDNCSTVFNPIRPVDAGIQPDSDADTAGDACGAGPFEAGTTDCVALFQDGFDWLGRSICPLHYLGSISRDRLARSFRRQVSVAPFWLFGYGPPSDL